MNSIVVIIVSLRRVYARAGVSKERKKEREEERSSSS
jgi:hypothetical protein